MVTITRSRNITDRHGGVKSHHEQSTRATIQLPLLVVL